MLKNIPRQSVEPTLPVHYLDKIQRTGIKQNADNREAQRKLVADHLSARSQATEQRIFIIGRPTRQHDSINAYRRESENVEQSYVHASHMKFDVTPKEVYLPSVWYDYECHQRRNQRERRSEDVKPFVCLKRNDVLLEDHLHPIGQRLHQTPQPELAQSHAIRTNAQLYPRHDLAFHQGHICDCGN